VEKWCSFCFVAAEVQVHRTLIAPRLEFVLFWADLCMAWGSQPPNHLCVLSTSHKVTKIEPQGANKPVYTCLQSGLLALRGYSMVPWYCTELYPDSLLHNFIDRGDTNPVTRIGRKADVGNAITETDSGLF
jgi:hypothetical protein